MFFESFSNVTLCFDRGFSVVMWWWHLLSGSFSSRRRRRLLGRHVGDGGGCGGGGRMMHELLNYRHKSCQFYKYRIFSISKTMQLVDFLEGTTNSIVCSYFAGHDGNDHAGIMILGEVLSDRQSLI